MSDAHSSQLHVRDELLRLTKILLTEFHRPEKEYDELVGAWDRLCPHPGGTNILFWPDQLGLCKSEDLSKFKMSAEEIVEYAMNWEPRIVAMHVIKKGTARPSKRTKGYHIYNLGAPEVPNTQIVTSLDESYEEGATVAVALKGVQLDDVTVVEREFKFGGPTSIGKILGPTDKIAGTRIDPVPPAGLGR
jgi:hypothetical protein